MKRVIKIAILGIAMMTLSLGAFAQEPDKGIGLPGTSNPSIMVHIAKNGCGCPSTGHVQADFEWIKYNPIGYEHSGSEPQYYAQIPATVTLTSLVSYQGYTVHKISLYIFPGGTAIGLNSTSVPGGTNVATINPSKCCLDCTCPDDKEDPGVE